MSLAKASLLRRFPGIDGQIGESVAAFARATGEGYEIQTWHDIRPEIPHSFSGWICYLHARAPWLPAELQRFPLVLTDGSVKPDDKPTVFNNLAECEREANKALIEYEATIRRLKPQRKPK